MRAVLFAVALAVFTVSVSLALPGAIAFSMGEPLVARLGLYAALGLFASGSTLIALWGRVRAPGTIGALSISLGVWAGLPFAIAVPFADLAGLSYVDALFECVSALTTTGASVLEAVDDAPRVVVVLRSQLSWMGGLMTILTILLVLAPLGLGGLSVQALPRSRGRVSMLGSSRLGNLVYTLSLIYGVLTLVGFMAFLLVGIDAFAAFNLALTAVASGGFLPFDAALLDVTGVSGLLVFSVLLLIAATSIFWHGMVLRWQVSRLRTHRESYLVVAVTLALAIILFISLNRLSGPGESVSNAAESLFNAASLVSTSGIESRPGVLTLVALPVVVFVMLAGGSAYSTSGGIKLYRLGGMVVQSGQELHRLVYPSGVLPARFGSQYYDVVMIRAVWSFFVAAMVTIAVGAVLVAPSAVNFEAALVATVAAFSGAGPVYEAGWAAPGTPAWPGWEGFDTPSKLVLCAVMILGRVEVLSVVALFSLRYWRTRS